jgi:hypothetical protein
MLAATTALWASPPGTSPSSYLGLTTALRLFFGSRGTYREYFDEHPGTYYVTTGWSERNFSWSTRDQQWLGDYARPAYGRQGVMKKLGLTETYEEMLAKYGKDNADFIAEMLGDWTKNYTKFLYLSMDICEETAFIEATRKDAEERGWEFEVRKGDLSLLRKLFMGQWDEDFVIVPPGGKIVARNDENVLDAETAPETADAR